ncbi:L-serine ammonia-lyase, iron-sulfur-dependent, subunit alpha [uncultured Sphaerochaeta sp.]|uniref:L-cysteine desulfidase family protein n=1 Tax=uncultured Sphaerochaeta sp. TaxID=886478 RepID=UPI002A0A4DA8|nr:L-serine ammonia-lyase, iron-sulfur-dependent, subunit alpha [uncultured Sphaerochaeta sp.]
MDQRVYAQCLAILTEELVPALGCTEPIAIAYASAKARQVLGVFPDSILVRCSGNIIKNVKGVTVPNSGGLKGVEASAVLGAIGGNAEMQLETLSGVTSKDIQETKEFLAKDACRVELIENGENLQIIVEMRAEKSSSLVEIVHSHTFIGRIEKDGQILVSQTLEKAEGVGLDYGVLNLDTIFDFVETVRLEDVKTILDRQVSYNYAIAQEGLKNSYGATVGATLLKHYGNDVTVLAKALPAAGSDARMNGCSMPVVINSGSGNQGMTVCLPVEVYASFLKVSEDCRYRALVLSNLIAIYQKINLGKLSAYCGAVSASAGSGAGIAYLHKASRQVIEATITNTLANVSGIVCDGAKASCAAKIASSVDAAQMAYFMAADGHVFLSGDGLVKKNTEQTIKSIGRLGREGMRETDQEIFRIMLER